MPSISETRQTILQQLGDAEFTAERLVAGLSPAQANWQPNSGRSWSICQCLNHLGPINHIYCHAMLDSTAHVGNGVSTTASATPGWFGRLFIQQLEPPVRTRMKAPKKAAPATECDVQVELQEFVDSHSQVRRIIASWEQVDLNRVRFRNPFVPLLRFTVATGLMIINAHDRRHLWQAARVKESNGYPTV